MPVAFPELLAVALERLCFGDADESGFPSQAAQDDARAILGLEDEPEEDEEAASYAFNQDEPRDQPGNAGQWAEGGGSGAEKDDDDDESEEAGEGELIQPQLSLINFPGGFGKEVTPLQDNRKMPVIICDDPKGYRLVDGWGRVSGMINAGKTHIHAIYVTKGDLAERSRPVGVDDEEWNEEMYERYAPDLTYRYTTNSRHDDPLIYESHHAPTGGITINGTDYKPGEFIPAEEVAKASHEDKSKLTRKRSLPEHLKAILNGETLKGIAGHIAEGVAHPVKTAGKAKNAAQDRLKAIYQKYGPAGAAAVGAAYVAYYATALANPIMFTVPVPLTPTIMTCAELIRKGIEKAKGKQAEEGKPKEPEPAKPSEEEKAATYARQQRQEEALRILEVVEAKKAIDAHNLMEQARAAEAAQKAEYARQRAAHKQAEAEERAEAWRKTQRHQAEEAALYAAQKADEDRAALSAKERKSLLADLKEAVRETVAELLPSPVVGQRMERDSEDRIIKVIRTHEDGTESVQKIKRDKGGEISEVSND